MPVAFRHARQLFIMSALLQCVCVQGGFTDWCNAVKLVVRPEEVRHLVRFGPRIGPHTPHNTFANDAANFVRQYEYIPDPQDCDRWCSPRGTMERGGGDCDDLSVLGVSLLHAGNTDASLMVGRWADEDGPVNHAWIEGTDAFGWFHIEATSGVLRRGRRPAGYYAHYQLHPNRCLDLRPLVPVKAAFPWKEALVAAAAVVVVGGVAYAARNST